MSHSQTVRRVTIAFIILIGIVYAGYGPVLKWATSEPAPWSYVENAWGGLALSRKTIGRDRVTLTFTTQSHPVTQLDSGLCVCSIDAHVDGLRVLVRLDRCVCGNSAMRDWTATLSRPPQGRYDVVYDDRGAGFPRLGELAVP